MLLKRLMTPRPADDLSVPVEHKPRTVVYSPTFLGDVVRAADKEVEYVRSSGFIHVSDLNSLCRRKVALVEKHSIKLRKSVNGAMRVLWKMGKAAEHHIRSQVITSWNYENIIGQWRCPCETLTYPGFFKRGVTCHRCRFEANIYEEFDLVDHSLRICGHPDLLLYVNGEVVPVEIKSVKYNPPASKPSDKECFVALSTASEPLPNHAFQVTTYRKMLADRNTLPISRYAIVYYVAKDYQFKDVYKEFHIDASTGVTLQQVNNRFELVRQLRQEQASGELAPRLGGCGSSDSPMAKNCQVCTTCFSV